MKTLAYPVACLSVLGAAVSAAEPRGVTLEPPTRFTFEFSDLPYFRENIPRAPDQLNVQVRMDMADPLERGEFMTVRMFEDSATDIPFSVQRIGLDPFTPAANYFSTGWRGAFWADLQGVIELEMTPGTVRLEAVGFSVTRKDGNYFQLFAVPEPSSTSLLFLGGAGMLVSRRLGRVATAAP